MDVKDIGDFARHKAVEEGEMLVVCGGAEITEVIHCKHH
jgi:hypothetical protein